MVPYKELNESAAVAAAFIQIGAPYIAYVVGVGAAIAMLGKCYHKNVLGMLPDHFDEK